MKNKNFVVTTIVVGIILVLASCTELKKDLPIPTNGLVKVHEPGWMDTSSSHFHGYVLKVKQYNLNECVSCHAKSFNGGISGVRCFTCHQIYPHKSGWNLDTASANFHGKFLLSGQGIIDSCTACHGSDFNGGLSEKSCYTCHAPYPHKAGWGNSQAANSHGRYLKGKDWDVSECSPCHGSDFTGGTSGISCRNCHVTFPHAADFAGTNGHPVYMRNNGFPFNDCKLCHGSSYAGGSVVDVSCRDCHSTTAGPEACNTCHGDFNGVGLLSSAPPKSVSRDTSTTVLGVGAHQRHLITGTLGKLVKCQECHTVPSSVTSSGHIDSPFQVQVVFNDTLARLKTSGGTIIPNPTFNLSDSTCSNVFCHGYFTNGNHSNRPQWNKVNRTQSACGTCHGDPVTGVPAPLGGSHDPATDYYNCESCHTMNGNPLASYNGSKWIINDTLRHINGKLNLFDSEQDF